MNGKLIALLILLMSFFQSKAQLNDVYVVKAEKLNLRKEPSSKSPSLGYIGKNNEVLVIGVASDWYYVQFGDYKGWLNKAFLLSKSENSFKKIKLNTGDSPECDNMDWRFDTSSKSELRISVGNGADFAIKLMENKTNICRRAFYVKSGESIIIKDIPEGSYYLKIAHGLDFRQGIVDGKCLMVFNRNATYKISPDILNYNLGDKILKEYNGQQYESQQIPSYSLHLDVPRGRNIEGEVLNTDKISKEKFNQ